jgi:hypothetical protein
MPGDFWKKRWASDRVDFRYSYGMFDEDKLVGFIINGIDFRGGVKTAFNAGTGVLPAYRGRRIVKELYTHALPEFKAQRVQSCALEVITKNENAIKAYQSVGMGITKTYKCYGGTFDIPSTSNSNIFFKKINNPKWDLYNNFNTFGHAWGNSQQAIILNHNYDYHEMWQGTILKGYFIMNPKNGTIAQFEIKGNDWSAFGDVMFSKIASIQSKIKINNQDDRNRKKVAYLQKIKLSNVIDQYEMEMDLK